MKNKHVNFINSQGLTLDARLDMPEDPDTQSLAVFAHCFTCNKDFKAAAYISQTLTNRGIGVLRFDFTGLGQSQGFFEETNFSTNVSDLLSAAQYLAGNGKGPFMLVGHSLGGTAALYAADQIPSVTAVVTIGSPAEPRYVKRHFNDVQDKIETQGEAMVSVEGRRFTFTRQFLRDLEQAPLADRIGRFNKALLVLHAPEDQTVGVDNAAAIFKAARHPKSFVALAGADHLLSKRQDAEYAAELIAVWAKRYAR
ncbi:MAG: alpha/beta fold hydrolase [Desulfosarcinaceae bacterium]